MTDRRVPPHSPAAEEALIGAMLLSGDARAAAAGLDPADFYRPALGRVFEALLGLDSVDAVTAVGALDADTADAVGGLDGLLGLMTATGAVSHAGAYAATIADTAARRRLIAAGAEVARGGWETPAAAEAVQAALEEVSAVAPPASALVHVGEAAAAALDAAAAAEEGGVRRPVPLGVAAVDEALGGGIAAGQLCVLAARTGVGKTSLALRAAASCAEARPVLFVSLEMSAVELGGRLGHSHTQRSGDWDAFAAAVAARVDPLALWIDDTSTTAAQIDAAAAKPSPDGRPWALVVVDYTQLLRAPPGRFESRALEVAQITRSLKLTARRRAVAVLALSQLRRTDRAEAAAPRLDDLRESGAIEQDADIVVLVSQAGDRDRKADGRADPDEPEAHTLRVQLAKNRTGPVATAQCTWWPQRLWLDDRGAWPAADPAERPRPERRNARLPYRD